MVGRIAILFILFATTAQAMEQQDIGDATIDAVQDAVNNLHDILSDSDDD